MSKRPEPALMRLSNAKVWSAAVADIRSVSPKSMAESCHSAWSRGACAAFLAGHFKRELSHQHDSKWRSRFGFWAIASSGPARAHIVERI